jgi:hypothetical protein
MVEGEMKNNRTTTPQNRSITLALVLAGLCVAIAVPARPQDQIPSDALKLTGDIPVPVSFKAADLDAMPQETATVNEEDGTATKYSGVLVRSILEKVGAPAGKSLRGKGMASYVLAKARDGYQVAFTPAELDPSFGNERVIVAYKREGKPLFGYQGPFRMICPNDKAGARSIRMLDSIEVVRLRK